MREEFKFVKGLYTNKKLFDDDIIADSFVILDSNCKDVSFTAEDNSATQSQLIEASDNDRVCKVYTITPDKITMEGNLEKGTEGSDYKFTPKINEIIDDNESIPSDVINAASEKLVLTANYNLDVGNIGIGEESNPELVEVTFTDNKKSFKRSMMFKATGDVDKRSLVNVGNVIGADLKNDEVYYLENSEYKMPTNINDNDVFRKGRKQTEVQGDKKYFPELRVQLKITSSSTAEASVPAHYYKAPEHYQFNFNSEDELTVGELGVAITTNVLGLKPKSGAPGGIPQVLTFIPPTMRDNTMFAPDALGKYIIDSNKLKKITADALGNISNYAFNKEQTVYDIEDSEINNYYVYDNSAYQYDSNDTNVYLKLGDSTPEPISDDNVRMTNIYTAAPLFNLDKEHPYTMAIKEDTFKITATEVQSY